MEHSDNDIIVKQEYDRNVNWPKITIITPSFNQGHFIEETILSVISQQYPNLEYIIIDGGSKDNTVEVIKKYEEHISYWISEQDKGQSDAINKGLARATGDIVNWLNSDDYYFPGTLKKVAKHFISHPDVNVVCGKSRIFVNEQTKFIAEGTFFDSNSLEQTLCVAHIEQPATFFRSKAASVIGPVSMSLHYVMDKEWWMKYLLNFGVGNILYTGEVYVNFRHHETSKTISVNERFYDEHASILHSLASQKGLDEYKSVLEIKYRIQKDYVFTDKALKDTSRGLIERMIVHFMLKWAHMIFTRQDFKYALEVLSLINVEHFTLNEQERDWYNRAVRKTSTGSWLIFRIRRKLKWISRKKV